MSHIRLLPFGCFLLLVPGSYAGGTQIINCPFTISTPGQYHISKDLTCPQRDVPAITVAADNVVVLFDGHTLDGAGTGLFGVLVAGSNDLVVGGGTVTRFLFGLAVESPSDDEPTSGNRIVNITVTNALNQGIFVINSVQNQIINCTANGNGRVGILLGSDNTLISSTASQNVMSGIEIFGSNNTLRANETDGNGFNGIFVDVEATGNLIQANRAANNTPFDLVDLNANCDSNIWMANQFRRPNQSCIQ
jgi:parallel beta-helix repeat protein